MLEMLASLASLLGFSIQVFDKYKSIYPGNAGIYIGLFIELNDTVQSWKNIHHNYQAISEQLSTLERYFYDAQRPLPPNEIRANDVRNLMRQAPFMRLIRVFEENMEPQLQPLIRASNLTPQQITDHINKVRSRGFPTLATAVHSILTSQTGTIKRHREFCDALRAFRPLLDDNYWTHAPHIEAIFSKQTIWFSSTKEITIDADIALLSFLDIYQFAADKVRKNESASAP